MKTRVGPNATNLNITSPPIQIQMQIFNLSIIRKLIIQILLACFLMDIRDDDDPAFDRADGCRVRVRLHGCRFAVYVCGMRLGVDVHLVGHDGLYVGKKVVRWRGFEDHTR